MAGTSRAAFAEVLDDHWKIFRDHLLEAIPESQPSEPQVFLPLEGPALEDNSSFKEVRDEISFGLPEVAEASGGSSLRSPTSEGQEPVSQVPSLPDIIPKGNPALLASESFSSQQSTVQGVDSVGQSRHQRANIPYLISSLDNLQVEEARAIRHRLRVRLGAMCKKKMVSGQSLHDAVQALGLTRYSVDEMNDLVNLLSDFIGLSFQARESVAKKRRRQTIFSWEEDYHEDYGDWVWKWPQVKEMKVARAGSMASMSVLSEHQANSSYNLVPASALMELFLAQDSEVHRRIFGSQVYKQFLAMREILLAGDTNRLVAELTFVRINDLAAPPEPMHPLMYVEPFVAFLIVANGIMIGFQTEPNFQAWDGWTVMECVFAGFLVLEILLRMNLLGCRTFWCGDDQLWNWFDVLLCLTGITDVTVELVSHRRSEIPTSLLRFCRLIRLVRIVKVFRLKFMKDLRLMVKGLVAGIRTLTLAFTLLVCVIYVIAGFATYTIGASEEAERLLGSSQYFRNLPLSMFTAFRCFTGECTNDLGYPMTSILAQELGPTFVAAYIVSYMLVTMGIFNVILAVYVEITMKAAKETEATTAEQYARESIRVARTTRELLKKFAAAYRIFQDLEETEGHRLSRIEFRGGSTIFTDDDVHDKIAITKELFLLVIQDRDVQRLMDELDLPPDRANLFEVIDADGSGTLHITELVQGLLQIRGEIKKSDTVAALLATKAVQSMVAEMKEGYEKNLEELKVSIATELQKLTQLLPTSKPVKLLARTAHV